MEPSTTRAGGGLRRKLAALLAVSALLSSILTCAAFASSDPESLRKASFWILALATTACSQVLALLIAALANATLSMQLTGLTARVRKLRERQDFSRRIGPSRYRLLHELTSAIDELLWTVEVRERELTRQRGELEELLASRSKDLDKKTRELRLLLSNVDQGVLLLNAESLPTAERSATFDRWFGAPEPGQTFGKIIARAASDFDQRFAQLWKRLSEGFLPVELELLQLPSHFSTQSGRHYHVTYRMDGESSGRFEQLLVLVTDISALVEREGAEAERLQLTALIEQVGRDRMGFAGRFHELDSAVQHLTSMPEADPSQLLLGLAALRSKFSLLRLRALAGLVQAIEEVAADLDGRGIAQEDFTDLAEGWERFASHARLLLGEAAQAESLPPRRVGSRY